MGLSFVVLPKVCACCDCASAGSNSKKRSGYATVGSDVYADDPDDEDGGGSSGDEGELDGSDLETIRKLSLYQDELEKEDLDDGEKSVDSEEEEGVV